MGISQDDWNYTGEYADTERDERKKDNRLLNKWLAKKGYRLKRFRSVNKGQYFLGKKSPWSAIVGDKNGRVYPDRWDTKDFGWKIRLAEYDLDNRYWILEKLKKGV